MIRVDNDDDNSYKHGDDNFHNSGLTFTIVPMMTIVTLMAIRLKANMTTMTIATFMWLSGRVVNHVDSYNYDGHADDKYDDDDNSHLHVVERQGCQWKPSTRPKVPCKLCRHKFHPINIIYDISLLDIICDISLLDTIYDISLLDIRYLNI